MSLSKLEPFTAGVIFIPLSIAILFSVAAYSDSRKYEQPIVEKVVNLEQLTKEERILYFKAISYSDCLDSIDDSGLSFERLTNSVKEVCNPILDF